MSDAVFVIVLVLIIVALIGAGTTEIKGEQATCTTKKLANSSFIVCTYKNKILYSGEIKNE